MAKGAQAKADKAKSANAKAEKDAAAAEAAEAAKWQDGGGKKGGASKADKAAEAARKREEKERLKAEDEAETANIKSKSGAGKKSKDQAPKSVRSFNVPDVETSSLSASGIDSVLEGLDAATGKNDKASLGSKAAKDVDTHPERRFKAAYEAYSERELPILKEEKPGLRLQQYKDLLYKQFQKSDENPFNQTTAAYNSTKADKVEIVQNKRKDVEKRLGGMSLN